MYCENPYYGISLDPTCGEPANHSMFVKQSLILDGENGDSVKALVKPGKKTMISETKTTAALKSHSDAERRRRERINAHLDTLRGLVPNSEKMDKATLLAKVIGQVKQLKAAAAQASQGMHVPTDTDSVEVAILENKAGDGSLLLKASLCCDYKPDLLADIRRAIDGLPILVLKCEVSSLGSRMKSTFLIAPQGKGSNGAVCWESIASSIRVGLSNVLDKVSASTEYDGMIFPRKRQRVSTYAS